MGLPIGFLIAANNENACLHRLFSKGIFSKAPIQETVSSAIDILIPYNFWRYLYFATGQDAKKIKTWMQTFQQTGYLQFEEAHHQAYAAGFLSLSITDAATLQTIKDTYETENYLLDPHAAVAYCVADKLANQLGNQKTICLATAHPAKFSETMKKALTKETLPEQAQHPSIELAKKRFEKVYLCEQTHLEEALMVAMEANWKFKQEVK